MSDPKYILGTDEYVVCEFKCTRPGFSLDSSKWTVEVTLVAVGETFVDDEETLWVDALVETVDGRHYAMAKLIDLLDPVQVGKYRPLVRATHAEDGYELPLLRPAGFVEVTP